MPSHWIRGTSNIPAKRRIVLIYEPSDGKNEPLERLLERIPYGQVNKTLLDCLRTGAQIMLANSGDADTGSATPKTSQPSAPSFSKSAARMFEMSIDKPNDQ